MKTIPTVLLCLTITAAAQDIPPQAITALDAARLQPDKSIALRAWLANWQRWARDPLKANVELELCKASYGQPFGKLTPGASIGDERSRIMQRNGAIQNAEFSLLAIGRRNVPDATAGIADIRAMITAERAAIAAASAKLDALQRMRKHKVP